MAHLAKSSAHVELPDKRLLNRPHLAILLGLVASEWANLENTLSFLYATLLGKYLPHNQRHGPPIHPIGIQIFETLENLNKRTQLLQKLWRGAGGETAIRDGDDSRARPENAGPEKSLEVARHRRFRSCRCADFGAVRTLACPPEGAVTWNIVYS
jgi:hypothetical protein